jgi:hypothetical protein
METRVQKLLDSHSRLSQMVHFIVPEQEELLKDGFEPDIPYERTVEEARGKPLVVLHTSRLLPLFDFDLMVCSYHFQHYRYTQDYPLEPRVWHA